MGIEEVFVLCGLFVFYPLELAEIYNSQNSVCQAQQYGVGAVETECETRSLLVSWQRPASVFLTLRLLQAAYCSVAIFATVKTVSATWAVQFKAFSTAV